MSPAAPNTSSTDSRPPTAPASRLLKTQPPLYEKTHHSRSDLAHANRADLAERTERTERTDRTDRTNRANRADRASS